MYLTKNNPILQFNLHCSWFSIFRFFRCSFLILSFVFFFGGYLLNDFNLILIGVLLLFGSNIIYSFSDIKKHIVFFFFHITFFTFLLSRPTISMFRGNVWWYFDFSAVCFALNALFLTLLFMRIGVIIGEELSKRYEKNIFKSDLIKSESDFQKSLQIISLIFFFITMGVYMLLQMEKLAFIQGREYAEIYLNFKSAYPSYVQTIASMMKYALCFFLATLPSKRLSFIPLLLYLLSAVPALIIGQRNPIVLNAIFILLYYIIRDTLNDNQRWLGKKEIIFLLVCSPVIIIFLGMYNYLRDGVDVSMGIVASIVDLFYKQGVSFDVLCRAYLAIPYLPDIVAKNYTFGPFLDYFQHGSIAQALFDATPLGSQNSEIKAIYGNNFSHSMSYVAHPEYLSGHGWGSSYVLETFADWGYIGIVLFSLVLGLFFVLQWFAIYKNTFTRAIILVCMLSLFFIPRAEATGWLSFFITAQFWLSAIFCYFLAGLCSRRYSFGFSRRIGS